MQVLKLTKKYEKYPEYKDSGVEWLGKIPKDWSFDKLAHNLLRNDGGVWGDDDPTEKGNLVLRSTEISQQGLFNLETAITRKLSVAEFNKAKLLEGDLLVTKSSGSADHLGKTGLVTKEIEAKNAAFSNFMQRLRVNKNYNPKYIYYSLNNITGREQINYWGSTTSGLVNLNASIINRFIFAIPQISEQKKIVTYLNEKTSYIDQIIEKKQKLIELLSEKRTSVINNAVTKGLNSKAELVESSIDWIGKIPKGWEIKKLKSGFDFEKGKEAGKFTQEFVTNEKNKGEYPVYSGQTENDGILGKINTYKYNFPEGVLFSTTVGAKAMTTKFLVGKFSLSQNCVLMVPNKKANSAYFNYLLEIGFKRMRDNIPSHMQPSLRVSDLNKFIVLFPTVGEQKNIAEYLDKKTKFFDTTINITNKTIKLLKEFKSSLISNVVTGKVKV